MPLDAAPDADRASHRDVVVVGAGPAGSASAALLAAAGRDVLLLDRAHFPRPRPCSEYTGPGTAAILDRLGVLGRVDHGLGRRLEGMELVAPSGASLLLDYRIGGRPRPGMALPRTELDVALLDAARRCGADVWTGSRVAGLLADRRGVHGVLTSGPDGRSTTVRARLVIGADGRHSVVAGTLGLRRAVRWPRRLGLVAHYRGARWPEAHGKMWVGPAGYVGAAPLGDDLVSVGLVTPVPARPLGPTGAAFERLVATYPDLAERLATGRRVQPIRGVGPLAQGVRRCAGPGYLLVGDAAGFLDPFTGEGIYRALRGAELAAAAADHALAAPGGGIVAPDGYAGARRRAFRAKEHLTVLIQLFVQCPALMSYAVDRLRRRPTLAAHLSNVLGDVEPAEHAVKPSFLWALLRP